MIKDTLNDFHTDVKAMAELQDVAMGIFFVVVIGIISVYVVNEIYSIAAITTGSLFYTALTKITAIMNTGWSMMVIVVIAVLAGLIIYYIRGGFGGAGGAGGGGY